MSPASLGACADKMKELEEKMRVAQRVVDKLAKEKRALEAHLIAELERVGDEGTIGKRARALLKTSFVPTLEDDDAFYAHVKKTGDFSLLQRRLSSTAIRERWEEGKAVPGVKKFKHKWISITKAK